MTITRIVHARLGSSEIVHYTPGKWFHEGRGGQPRTMLTTAAAADKAFGMELRGGEVFLGKPGGKVFDQKVETLRQKRMARQ